ncbi:MAG: hypothetical protein HRT89_03980 [Lentisphaeria bacterium]|nr:hypothetical protein [Lentisphaeria bacterium]NQZ67209.1 hypothetical protein [Lentisphaeria bacterium]
MVVSTDKEDNYYTRVFKSKLISQQEYIAYLLAYIDNPIIKRPIIEMNMIALLEKLPLSDKEKIKIKSRKAIVKKLIKPEKPAIGKTKIKYFEYELLFNNKKKSDRLLVFEPNNNLKFYLENHSKSLLYTIAKQYSADKIKDIKGILINKKYDSILTKLDDDQDFIEVTRSKTNQFLDFHKISKIVVISSGKYKIAITKLNYNGWKLLGLRLATKSYTEINAQVYVYQDKKWFYGGDKYDEVINSLKITEVEKLRLLRLVTIIELEKYFMIYLTERMAQKKSFKAGNILSSDGENLLKKLINKK